MNGMLGKKIGMTQMYDSEGKLLSVTVIEAVPSEVLAVKTKEKDGYSAVRLGIDERKKPSKNQQKKRFIKEVRLKENSSCKVGDVIKVDIFTEGEYLDVIGTTKGKGFQGGMRRWGWHGGDSGHGSMFHRAPGSIGSNTFPGRVFKGKTMPGHMGHARKTIQNLKVVKIDKDNNLVAVCGAVPGNKEGYLVIKEAVKRPKKVEKKDDAKK